MTILFGVIAAMVSMAAPLMLAALGEVVSERAGVINVGLEGLMLSGAFAAAIAARASHSAWTGVFVGAVTGILVAAFTAIFVIWLSADQVVVGVVVNLLALGVTGVVYRSMFGATGTFLQTAQLRVVLFGQDALVLFAFALTPVIAWFLFRTRTGLLLRACGESAFAAAAAGVPVQRIRVGALLFCGAMASLGGAYLAVGENNTFVENMTAGRGFIVLAVVTSGAWNPWGCMVAALVFGAANALQFQFQAFNAHLPYDLFLALPYAATLIALAAGGLWSRSPADLGRPFRRLA
ncbi:MAG: ABC transporter permease [Armatimonadetes bacterium]|nr:ABC transporter permease [Armatimonadota bacterium]MDE2207092.1 ABC transporter permease [Armatimonadota bacterium]